MEWNDESLDLSVVFGERDEQILEAARTGLLPTNVVRNTSGAKQQAQLEASMKSKSTAQGKGKSKEQN